MRGQARYISHQAPHACARAGSGVAEAREALTASLQACPLQLGRLAGGGRADRHRRHSLLGCGA